MNGDLYDAWLTAGRNLQPAGDWAVANWPWLAVAASLAAIVWQVIQRLSRDDYRTRNDGRQAVLAAFESRPEPGAPGTDIGYLDCVAAYNDCDELDRLRDAIDQHRKENPL